MQQTKTFFEYACRKSKNKGNMKKSSDSILSQSIEKLEK